MYYNENTTNEMLYNWSEEVDARYAEFDFDILDCIENLDHVNYLESKQDFIEFELGFRGIPSFIIESETETKHIQGAKTLSEFKNTIESMLN